MKFASLTNIPSSATLAMNALVQEKKRKGEKVYNLSVGEPALETSHLIQKAAFAAIQAGKTLYPPVSGIPELREAVVEWMNKKYESAFQKENCLVSCGGKHGLLMCLQSLLEKEDEVLILAPYWVSYSTMVTLAGGVSKIIETTEEKNWKISPEQIASACTSQTKVLILNNGSNPTGVLYSLEEMKNILKIASEKNLIVISDEVYSGLTYDNNEYISVASFVEYKESSIIIQSVSKHFAMTGWRVGFVLGPKNLIDAVETLQSQSTTGTSSISQWAALAAFQNAEAVNGEIRREMEHRRDIFVQSFEKYFGKKISSPQCGLYSFLPISFFTEEKIDSVSFCLKVLEESNVAFVPGSPFGKEGYIRASFGGKPEEIEEALEHFSHYLKR